MLDVGGVEVGCEVLWEEGEEAVENVDLGVCECNGWEELESLMDMKRPSTLFRNKHAPENVQQHIPNPNRCEKGSEI